MRGIKCCILIYATLPDPPLGARDLRPVGNIDDCLRRAATLWRPGHAPVTTGRSVEDVMRLRHDL